MKKTIIVILLLLAAGTFINGVFTSAIYDTDDFRMAKIIDSPQLQNGVFVNPENNFEMKIMKSIPLIFEFLFKKNETKPPYLLPVKQIDFDQINNAGEKELKVTWVGHSSQIINIDGKIILTDPVYEKRAAIVGPTRYNGDVPLNMDQLPQIDVVLISHNHYDHLNTNTLTKIHPKVKHFIVPLMVGAELEKAGVPSEKIIELDWWDEVKLFDDFLIALTPSQHFSGRSLFDNGKTLWGSFVIRGPYHNIYFSGDSGYFSGFKEIGDKYGPFDYTFMECGAYDERWHSVHMMPEETAQAHLDLKGNIMQPMHWGTFDLALHDWYDPMVRVSKAADTLGIKLSTPIVGETITIDSNLATDRWWEPFIHSLTSNK